MEEYPSLETTRLRLRPFETADAIDVQRLAGEFAVADTTTIPHPYVEGLAEKWIASHQEDFAQQKTVHFAIVCKDSGKLIGNISLLGNMSGHHVDLGYWIGKEYWGQGFCTEAGKAVMQYAFTALAVYRVNGCHLSRNPASGRILRKLGMQHEGSCQKIRVKSGKSEDVECYGILREDWVE